MLGCLFTVACGPNLVTETPASPLRPPTVSATETSQTQTAVRHVVVEPSGERRLIADRSALEEHLPFEMVESKYLPAGFTLQSATVLLPPEQLDPTGRRRNTRLVLGYGHQATTAGSFSITQNRFEQGMSPDISPSEAEPVQIGKTQGMLVQRTVEDGEMIALAWTGCGVQFHLTARQSDVLRRSTVLRIAESTLARC